MKLKVMIFKFFEYFLYMMLMIFWCHVEDNNVIDVALCKTKSYQHSIHHPLKILDGHFSNQMEKIAIGTNNPSHDDQFP